MYHQKNPIDCQMVRGFAGLLLLALEYALTLVSLLLHFSCEIYNQILIFTKAVLLLWILFVICVCLCHTVLSVSSSLVVTCWERTALLGPLNLMFSCVFVTFPYGVLGQVWYLIVLIHDLCFLPYFNHMAAIICYNTKIITRSGLKVIKLEYSLRLKIKGNDWLLVDKCLQTANHCTLFWVWEWTQIYNLEAWSMVIVLKFQTYEYFSFSLNTLKSQNAG